MKKALYLSVFILVSFLPAVLLAQPANDQCVNATNLGTLNAPTPCPSGSTTGFNQGSATTLTGQTNIGATSSAPYPYLSECGVDLLNPPKDVWYTFVATGYQTTVNVTGGTGTLTNPAITIWAGSCSQFVGQGCIVGSGGAASLTIYQTVIGQTYYVQIAGGDSTQEGNFTISVASANNCAGCLEQSYVTTSPLPTNGGFSPGETVMFCYTVAQFDQGSANWLHGITVTFGAGWDTSTLVIDSLPPSCTPTAGAYWAWYPNGETSSATGNYYGPGFYYETSQGNTTCNCINTDPGDNFGDVDAADSIAGQPTCRPTFCLTITAFPSDTPGSNLNLNFLVTGDGESGSWSDTACGVDPSVTAFSTSTCAPPIMSHLNASCSLNNGCDTATPVGLIYQPFVFHWSNGYTDTTNGAPSIICNLAPGIYTVTVTNVLGCAISAQDSIGTGFIPDGGPTQYVSCPSLIDSTHMVGQGAGIWTQLNTNPAPTIIAYPDSGDTKISGFSAYGTYRYVWTIGCSTDTVNIIVSARPDAGDTVYTCVNGTATMAATGTGTWIALPGNPAPTTITNPTSPTTTITGFSVGGTYLYAWYVGNCYDTTAVIIPSFFSSAQASVTTLCRNQTANLTSNTGSASLSPFSYTWIDSADVVSPHSASTAIQPIQAPTNYVLQVTSSTGCVLYDTVFINVAGAAPVVQITLSDNNVCPGDTVQLGSVVYAENIVTCGLVDTCANNNLLSTANVANDTSSTTGSPFGFTQVDCSPFMSTLYSYRVQYLFRKSELNAAGLSSGSITNIAFYVKQINSIAPYDTFSVSMACTNQDSLTDFNNNNLMEVIPPQYGANAITPNLGWTPLVFTNYYNWDGASNIIIQICYSFNPNNVGPSDDYVSYTTTPFASCVVAGQYFSPQTDGCSLDSTADFYPTPPSLYTRANVQFGMCTPNILSYQWSPPTLVCDTCPNTAVIVNANKTYTLVVSDLGCSSTDSSMVTINPNIGVTATPPVAVVCNGGSVQLNDSLSNPPVSTCIQGYTVTSEPYAPISGAAPDTIQPMNYIDQFGNQYSTDDGGVAGPNPIGFSFPFYCQTYTQFYVDADAWISFVNPLATTSSAQASTAQTLPPAASELAPQDMIALLMGSYDLSDGFGFGGGGVAYFVSGTAPNRTLVIQFDSLFDATDTYVTTGEMHLHETSGIIDILLATSDYTGTAHTTGVKDSTGLGIAAPGMNNQNYTVSTPVAWKFTPEYGPSVAIQSVSWTPGTYLNNAHITDPLASPPVSETYYVTDTLIINQYTDPTRCIVRDSIKVNIGSAGPVSVSASPASICVGGTSQLTLTTGDTVSTYVWTPATGLSSTTVSDPTVSISDTTTYYVTVTTTSGCQLIDSVTVSAAPSPAVTLPASYVTCAYDTSVVASATGGTPGYTYIWSNGGTGPSTIDSILGSSFYTVTVTDANHCTAAATDTITTQYPGVSISVSPISDTIFINDTATVTASATGSNIYGYNWTSTGTATVLAPSHNATGVIGDSLGTDTVYLLVTDNNTGCTYSTYAIIHVVDYGAFVMPTAFTPNGDGMNDYFYPKTSGPNVIVNAFNIYDRWGQQVYANGDPSQGWDGKFKGQAQPTGIYVYFITLTYPDPNDASRTIQRSVEGSFQLFR